MSSEKVVIAEILRPRGNRGEVLARSQTDVHGRLESLRAAWAHMKDGTDRAVEFEEVWQHKADWVFKLKGIDSIDQADTLRGADIWVGLEERGHLPDGTFFQSDLVGFAVCDGLNGFVIGQVTGWQQFGGPKLLEVDMNGKEILIPFVDAICRLVDRESRTITVDLPDGLLDL